jgi:hypothetical protein
MRKLLCLLGIVLAVGAFAQNYVDITIGGKFIMRPERMPSTKSMCAGGC